MARRLKIPKELLILNPNLNIKEIRTILNIVLNSSKNRIRQAHIFKVRLPKLGVLRSHGGRKHRHNKKTKIRDVKRKRAEYREKEFTKEKLLW